MLLAWCLGGWESKGNIYIYIYSYFGMFSNYIHDFEFFFFLIAWCLGVEKMWESKEKYAFFFVFDLFGSKKLEATENQPNQTD